MDNDEVGSSVMNRRNVLVGLGAAATGSSVVLGSGAFAGVSTARSVTIAVDKDSEALVQLEAGDPAPVEENNSGELEISTENFGGAFNEDAKIEIGTTGNEEFGEGSVETPAFTITNNLDEDTDEDTNEEIDVTLDMVNIANDDTFRLVVSDDNDGGTKRETANSELVANSLSPDGTLEVAIEIDTDSPGSDFNGTLEISASWSGGS